MNNEKMQVEEDIWTVKLNWQSTGKNGEDCL